MSNLFNYINKSLIGAVIKGYGYSIATGHVDSSTTISYVVDRVMMQLNQYDHPIQVYVTIKIDPTYTTYTSISASNLLLNQIVYIPANLIDEIEEFPATNPLISQEEGLLGANIKGYKYNIGTGVIDSALTTCRIIDRVKIDVDNVLTDVYICVLYSGTTGSGDIYIPIHLLSEVVSFGIVDPGKPSVLRYTAMNFAQDATATTILFKDVTTGNVLRTEPINAIQAVANGANIRIQNTGGVIIMIDALDIATTKIDGTAVTAVLATALTELNALFAHAGSVGNAPTITNTTPINLIQGNTLNLTMAGTDIVAYSWVGLPTGVVPVNGNERNIIGGSALALGTYPFTARATNYYGETTKALELVVGSSFINTYSFWGGAAATNKHFLVDSAITSQSSSPLFRAANSTGNASDSTYAWSVVFYHKSNATHTAQNGPGAIFGAGGTKQNRSYAGFDVRVSGTSTDTEVHLMWGSKFSYVDIDWTAAGVNFNNWKQITISYNGGDTKSTTNPSGTSGVAACFEVHVNGTLITANTPTLGNNGFSGVINANGLSGTFSKSKGFRIALSQYGPVNYHSNELYIDELGVYDYVLSSSEISTLWNGGTSAGLNNIGSITNPVDYFRMGDGSDPSNPSNTDINQFPVMYNFYTGRFNMEATNMVVADYASDTPP